MRLTKKRLLTAASLACLFSATAQADIQVNMQHSTADAYENGEQTSITLSLQVQNQGDVALYNARLYPAGNALPPSLQARHIPLGYLPMQGQSNVSLSLETPLAADYFNAGMPLFFYLKARSSNGETVVLPIYSQVEVY